MSRVRWPIPSHDPNLLGRLRTTLFTITKSITIDEIVTNEIRLRDSFTRVTSPDSWGKSDSNHTYTWIGDANADASVDGDKGIFTATAVNNNSIQYVDLGSGIMGCSGLARFAFSEAPSSNLNRIAFDLLNTSNAGIQFRLENSTSNQLSLYIMRDGVNISPTHIVVSPYTYPDWYYIRFLVLDNVFTAKAWKVGDTEPGSWQVTGRDGTYNNFVRFRAFSKLLSTNFPSFYFDDFDILAGPASIQSAQESIAESVTNVATSVQTLLSAEADAANQSGTATFTVADATAETVSQVNNPGYGEGEYGEGPYGNEYITLLEALAESPSNETSLRDTFQRVVAPNSWGKSDSGQSWSTAVELEVDGSKGRIRRAGTSGTTQTFVTIGHKHQTGIVKANAEMLADAGNCSFAIMSADSSGGNGLAVSFLLAGPPPGDNLNLRLTWITPFIDFTVTSTYTPPDEYYMKWDFLDHHLKVKAWKVGDAEPTSWQINKYFKDSIDRPRFYVLENNSFTTNFPNWYVDDLYVAYGPISIHSFSSESISESQGNEGNGSFSGLEAEAQNIDNSAESTQTLEETIFVPGAVKPIIIQVKAHSYPELVPVTKFIGAFTVSTLEITETLINVATSTQSLSEAEAQAIDNSSSASITILSAEAQALNNSGSGSFTVADATAEIVSISQTSTQSILEALAETATNSATAVITLTAEAIAETNTNTATNTPAILSAEAQDANNSGTGSFTTADATAETVFNSATSDQTILEAIGVFEFIDNSATAIVSILSAEAQTANNSGSGSFTTADATAETVINSATAVIAIDEVITGQTVEETIDNVGTSNISILSAEAQAANVAGTGTFTVADATAEITVNSGTATQTMDEAFAEIFVNSATNVPAIVAADLEALVNSGTATITDAEAIAESMSSFAIAVHSMLENGTIRLFPDEDIGTGTWHDTPLWPKIDEMNPVGGYPTEAIISGNDPVNDTAVLGLQSGSDPSMDIDHFINVQFYKIGSPGDDVDFIIKLKQGGTVIATRTFVDVQETESAPRTERIGLTTGEVANITNYADLNFEIIANKTN